MNPKKETTDKIKSTLGASYTVAEVELFIYRLHKKLEKQTPIFNSRDLEKLDQLREALK
jgi:hypothetical protein